MIYNLPYNIVIEVKGGTGRLISSDLHKEFYDEETEYDSSKTMADVVESLILAHACAGIDVASPAYVEGLETMIEAIGNNL